MLPLLLLANNGVFLANTQQQPKKRPWQRYQTNSKRNHKWIRGIYKAHIENPNSTQCIDSASNLNHCAQLRSIHLVLFHCLGRVRSHIGCAKCWWQIFQIDNEFPLGEWIAIEIYFPHNGESQSEKELHNVNHDLISHPSFHCVCTTLSAKNVRSFNFVLAPEIIVTEKFKHVCLHVNSIVRRVCTQMISIYSSIDKWR